MWLLFWHLAAQSAFRCRVRVSQVTMVTQCSQSVTMDVALVTNCHILNILTNIYKFYKLLWKIITDVGHHLTPKIGSVPVKGRVSWHSCDVTGPYWECRSEGWVVQSSMFTDPSLWVSSLCQPSVRQLAGAWLVILLLCRGNLQSSVWCLLTPHQHLHWQQGFMFLFSKTIRIHICQVLACILSLYDWILLAEMINQMSI